MKRTLTIILSAVLSACIPSTLRAQQTEALSTNGYDFKWSQTILPASLITAGAIFVPAGGKLRGLSNDITFSVSGLRGEGPRLRFDDYVQYIPVASSLLLGCTGIETRHSFRDRAIIVATSYAALGLFTNVTKICVDEKRPEFDSHNSFPSGHSATVFMGAELVRIEYGGWYGAAAYGIAAGVGFMRIYNGRHWFHDVVAGAGVGILSARIGEWSCELWQRAFPALKGKSFSFAPVAIPSEGGYYGLALACNF